MKPFKPVAAVGTILAVAAIVFALRGGRKGHNDADGITGIPFQTASYDSHMLQPEGIDPYLEDLSFLTEEEKTQLRKDEEELRPIYEKMDELGEKSRSAREAVLEKHQALFDREEELLSQGDPLREKIIAEFPNNLITPDNWREYIQASKVLTEEEKKKMLQWEDELERLDQELQQVYEEADAAAVPYDSEWEEYNKKANDIYERSQSIHQKIYENDVESGGYTIPATPSTEQ